MKTLALLLSLLAPSTTAEEGLPAVVPENLERLDPLVVELIEARVAGVVARPADAASHGELAMVYEANKLWPQARQSYANAVRLAPEDLLWRFHLAIAHRELGEFEASLELFEALAAEHPEFSPVQQRLGEALLEAGNLERAKAAYGRLVSLEPKWPHGYVGLGDVLLRQGEAERAADVLHTAVLVAPEYRAAHYLLGTAYLRMGRVDDARQELELGADSVLDHLPDPLTPRISEYEMNLSALLNRAGIYLDAGRPRPAVDLLEKVRGAHPENATVLNNLAIAYMRTGRLGDAFQALETARGLDPEQFSTYLNLTFWALRVEDYQRALEYSDAAVARAPDMAQPYFTRAQALAHLGRHEDALASLASSRALDPTNPSTEAFSGDLCLELRRFDAARAHYSRATSIAAGFLPAWLGLVRANMALGRGDDARAALAEARRVAPGHPMLTRLEQELDRNE